jgi:hypothetical protein
MADALRCSVRCAARVAATGRSVVGILASGGVRAMVGLALVKSVYTLPTWTRTVALVRDHAGPPGVLGAVA